MINEFVKFYIFAACIYYAVYGNYWATAGLFLVGLYIWKSER